MSENILPDAGAASSAANAPPPVFQRRIASTQAEIPPLCDEIEQWGEPIGIPAVTLQAICLMLDELITNIITHGLRGEPGHSIDVVLRSHPGAVEVLLRDTAPAFDPRTVAPPDTAADVASRAIGGLGIHLVRRLSDSFGYRRDGDANEVSLRKTFPTPEQEKSA